MYRRSGTSRDSNTSTPSNSPHVLRGTTPSWPASPAFRSSIRTIVTPTTVAIFVVVWLICQIVILPFLLPHWNERLQAGNVAGGRMNPIGASQRTCCSENVTENCIKCGSLHSKTRGDSGGPLEYMSESTLQYNLAPRLLVFAVTSVDQTRWTNALSTLARTSQDIDVVQIAVISNDEKEYNTMESGKRANGGSRAEIQRRNLDNDGAEETEDLRKGREREKSSVMEDTSSYSCRISLLVPLSRGEQTQWNTERHGRNEKQQPQGSYPLWSQTIPNCVVKNDVWNRDEVIPTELNTYTNNRRKLEKRSGNMTINTAMRFTRQREQQIDSETCLQYGSDVIAAFIRFLTAQRETAFAETPSIFDDGNLIRDDMDASAHAALLTADEANNTSPYDHVTTNAPSQPISSQTTASSLLTALHKHVMRLGVSANRIGEAGIVVHAVGPATADVGMRLARSLPPDELPAFVAEFPSKAGSESLGNCVASLTAFATWADAIILPRAGIIASLHAILAREIEGQPRQRIWLRRLLHQLERKAISVVAPRSHSCNCEPSPWMEDRAVNVQRGKMPASHANRAFSTGLDANRALSTVLEAKEIARQLVLQQETGAIRQGLVDVDAANLAESVGTAALDHETHDTAKQELPQLNGVNSPASRPLVYVVPFGWKDDDIRRRAIQATCKAGGLAICDGTCPNRFKLTTAKSNNDDTNTLAGRGRSIVHTVNEEENELRGVDMLKESVRERNTSTNTVITDPVYDCCKCTENAMDEHTLPKRGSSKIKFRSEKDISETNITSYETKLLAADAVLIPLVPPTPIDSDTPHSQHVWHDMQLQSRRIQWQTLKWTEATLAAGAVPILVRDTGGKLKTRGNTRPCQYQQSLLHRLLRPILRPPIRPWHNHMAWDAVGEWSGIVVEVGKITKSENGNVLANRSNEAADIAVTTTLPTFLNSWKTATPDARLLRAAASVYGQRCRCWTAASTQALKTLYARALTYRSQRYLNELSPAVTNEWDSLNRNEQHAADALPTTIITQTAIAMCTKEGLTCTEVDEIDDEGKEDYLERKGDTNWEEKKDGRDNEDRQEVYDTGKKQIPAMHRDSDRDDTEMLKNSRLHGNTIQADHEETDWLYVDQFQRPSEYESKRWTANLLVPNNWYSSSTELRTKLVLHCNDDQKEVTQRIDLLPHTSAATKHGLFGQSYIKDQSAISIPTWLAWGRTAIYTLFSQSHQQTIQFTNAIDQFTRADNTHIDKYEAKATGMVTASRIWISAWVRYQYIVAEEAEQDSGNHACPDWNRTNNCPPTSYAVLSLTITRVDGFEGTIAAMRMSLPPSSLGHTLEQSDRVTKTTEGWRFHEALVQVWGRVQAITIQLHVQRDVESISETGKKIHNVTNSCNIEFDDVQVRLQ